MLLRHTLWLFHSWSRYDLRSIKSQYLSLVLVRQKDDLNLQMQVEMESEIWSISPINRIHLNLLKTTSGFAPIQSPMKYEPFVKLIFQFPSTSTTTGNTISTNSFLAWSISIFPVEFIVNFYEKMLAKPEILELIVVSYLLSSVGFNQYFLYQDWSERGKNDLLRVLFISKWLQIESGESIKMQSNCKEQRMSPRNVGRVEMKFGANPNRSNAHFVVLSDRGKTIHSILMSVSFFGHLLQRTRSPVLHIYIISLPLSSRSRTDRAVENKFIILFATDKLIKQ